MTNTKTGRMATDRPERYAKQLAGHWARKTEQTEFDGDTVLTFAGGQAVSMRAEQGGLLLAVTVPEDADLDSFAQVVEEHLQRFGRRDELRVDWD
ncbi:MAG: DUF2218 domain-containing protein [Candidatus Nanopelagicales bacterium]